MNKDLLDNTPDLSEKGRLRGEVISMNRRLYFQFLAFTHANDTQAIVDAIAALNTPAAVYAHLNDAEGIGICVAHEDPAFFIDTLRPALQSAPFDMLSPLPEFTMFGKTYSIGYEPDLEETLFARPTRHLINPDWPWAIWYPLRRNAGFNRLPAEDQRRILMEHGSIGRAYGEAGFAHDIRLTCTGMDVNDNDFVIGIMGDDLHGISSIVQAMRKTEQTAEWLDSLGPFFVGKVIWQAQG